MKIKNLDRWSEEDYHPKKQKIKRTKPRKKDLDMSEKGTTLKKTRK
tara:strand:+ start:3897 stop:4034 length:138 start_codon:yes stop_codon:yes gene_type:complete